MQTDMTAAVLHTVMALSALWFLVFYCWRSYHVDSLREKLFEVRHELFSLAESGKLRFDEPAYYLLRTQLNRMIRYAHKVKGISAVAWPHPPLESPRKKWIESLHGLSSDVKAALNSIEERMAVAVLWHLTCGSFVFAVVLAWHTVRILLTSPHPRRAEAVVMEAMGTSIEALDSRAAEEEREALTAAGA